VTFLTTEPHYLAPPRVEAAGHLLRLGFGEPDRWVLSCPPVHIR
jgi:hypothetical protein